MPILFGGKNKKLLPLPPKKPTFYYAILLFIHDIQLFGRMIC
jgi:hypothetical protein